MVKPVLIGGVLIGILSALPLVNYLNCVCCAWVIGGGVLASYLYIRDSAMAVTLGQGVLLGLVTGAVGAVVTTLFSIPLQFVLSGMGIDMAAQLNEALDSIPDMAPEARDALGAIFSESGAFSAGFLMLTGFINLVVFSLVGMLGGAIGVAIFEKRKAGPDLPAPAVIPPGPPDPPPPPAPEPPPPPPSVEG
jgi:hypothetical protein